MTTTITPGGSLAFAAQIKNTLTGDWLDADDVDSVEYTIYKLSARINGETQTAVTGHTAVSVPVTAVLEQPVLADWFTADTTDGYNFLHQPDSRVDPAFPDPGSYRVEYRITLTIGNPIILRYFTTAL